MGAPAKVWSPWAEAEEFERWWHAGPPLDEPAGERSETAGAVVREDRRLCRWKGRAYWLERCIEPSRPTWRHPFGWPAAQHERQVTRALEAAGIGVAPLLYSGAQRQGDDWRSVTVREVQPAFSGLGTWFERWDEEDTAAPLRRELAVTLCRLHLLGWHHPALAPALIRARLREGESGRWAELTLGGLRHVRRCGDPGLAFRLDFEALRRDAGQWPAGEVERLAAAYRDALEQADPR